MTNNAKGGTPPGKLLQVLGVAFGLAVLVGNTIGMGILRTPGEIAAQVPSIPLFMGVWVAGALYALLGALTVSELVAMRPRSGGQYPLVHHGLGPYPGFVVGWSDWLSSCGTIAAVSIVLGEYAGPLVPLLAGHEKLTACTVVIAFGLMQWRGIRIGDIAQQVTSLVKALALVALALAALFMSAAPGPAPVAAAPIAPALPMGIALLGSLAFMAAALISDTTHTLFALTLVAASWPVYRLFRRANLARQAP